MECLQSLSAYLVKHLVAKENLNAWAENGEIKFSPSAIDGGYELHYTSNFEMSDVKIAPTRLFMLITTWVQQYNPDRDTQGVNAPRFFVEPLASGRYDLGVKMDFIEQIYLVKSDGGDWLVDGERMALSSDFNDLLDVANAEQLIVFDGHTQDNGLSDTWK